MHGATCAENKGQRNDHLVSRLAATQEDAYNNGFVLRDTLLTMDQSYGIMNNAMMDRPFGMNYATQTLGPA